MLNLVRHRHFRYAVIADEVGAEGTAHFQGYLELTEKITPRPLAELLPGAHSKERRGTPLEAAEYCKKDGNFIEEGTLSKPGRRTDIEAVKRMVKAKRSMSEISDHTSSYQQLKFATLYREIHQTPRMIQDIDVRWYFGKTGSGKTRAAYDEFPNIYTPISYRWWQAYDGQTEVLIDDFRKDWCKFHELLKLLHRYPIKVETKGSHQQLQAATIIITTPFRPEETYETR